MSSKNKETAPKEEQPIEETPVEEAPEAMVEEVSETDALRAELESAQNDLAAEKDKNLRLRAEYDNFRKRSARERDNIYADVKADTLKKLLPIFDNLERALRQETADEAYKKGVEMTMTQFLEALQALGVTPIEAVGQKFDPNEHNAVMHMEDPEKGEGEIVQEVVAGVNAVYLRRLYEAETNTAAALRAMAQDTVPAKKNVDERIAELERETGMRYAAQQKEAIRLACERRLLAVTGGPGTGKTTIIQAILRLYDDMQLDCLLAAPTGRAAKRMTELTGREAYTIHRLLGAAWAAEGDELTFRKNESDPLRCGAVILDECSMVDITLIQALLKALPKGCRLVLVGDADQLPSVGPGSFFLDVLRSHAVAAVRLTEIFRQSGESRIIRNAHSINRGETPELRENKGDFFFLQRPSGERLAATVAELCSERLPRGMGIPSGDIQVLTPTRKGESGTFALNERLQQVLNPPAPGKKEKIFGETVFREGDRVMQIRNNYDIVWCKGGDTAAIMAGEMAPGSAPETGTGIFNGDLGTILRIDTENELIWIDFDEKLAWYGFEQLGELDHAFAVTVHKAQGSEYRAVVLAAGRAPARLLSRDLLYTAVTRARELLVVVGETAIVQAMIENGRKTRRYSGLRARLAGEV